MNAQQSPQGLRRRLCSRHLDRCAVAVEMGFVLPVLGVHLKDSGHASNAQTKLSPAAHEGVRHASLNATATAAGANQCDIAFGTRGSSSESAGTYPPSCRKVPRLVAVVSVGFPAGPPRAFCRQLSIPGRAELLAHTSAGS